MDREITLFIDDYFNEVNSGNAAVFAGAGLSVPAGFVDWRELLRPLANELSLNIDMESDLVAVAQFHVNANGNNRNRLHRAVIDALSSDTPPTINHRLLASLPIATWWTTNYDKLIEQALKDYGKIVDVKVAVPQLANTRPRRDAIVYKMHGDVDRPEEAVVTRDDYERYPRDRGAFINALAGDLVSKTFLFIGFSFTDPNLEYVLARVRMSFQDNQRRHYAIFRKRSKLATETPEAFEHQKTRQILILEDLKRFNIKAILVDNYSDITEILSEISRRHRRQTIFVSAAASTFEPWGETEVKNFMRSLGTALISCELKVATGLGLGVGNALFTGAVEEIMRKKTTHIEDALIIRPFPQAIPDENERSRVWEKYRRDIISAAGIALFLFGNKQVGADFVVSDGMKQEFDIASQQGLVLLPIGATGYMSKELSNHLLTTAGDKLPVHIRETLQVLAKPVSDLMTLIHPITDLVRNLKEGK